MFSRSGKACGFALIVPLLAVLAGCGMSGSRPAGNAAPVAQARAAEVRPEVPEAAAALHARAVDAMAAEAWLDAELELEQLVLEYPSFPGPYVNLAILHRRAGRPADAEAALERALAIAPNHPAANNELGMLRRERGEFGAAEASYRRAIAGDADYALAHYNLGVLLDLYLQRTDEALAHYETYQSLLAEPDREVDFWIVDIRRRLGLPDEPVRMAQEDNR